MGHYYQKFNEREYKIGDAFNTKREAQSHANSLRRSGNYYAIVRKSRKKWVVYRAIKLKLKTAQMLKGGL